MVDFPQEGGSRKRFGIRQVAPVILGATSLVALGDGVRIAAAAQWQGQSAAAAFFLMGIAALVLMTAVIAAIGSFVSGRGADNIVDQLADEIILEEHDAGNDVGSRLALSGDDLPVKTVMASFTIVLAAMTFWNASLLTLGFMTATFFTTAALMLFVFRTRFLRALISAALIAVGLNALFHLAQVQLPLGLFIW